MGHKFPLLLATFLILVGACTSPPPTQEPATLPPPTSTPAPSPMPAVTTIPTQAGVVITSPEDILGIWDSQVLYERGFHYFRDDGSLVIAYKYEDIDTRPVFSEPAKYWFEGETFHVEDFCGHGTYLLTLTKVEDNNRTLAFKLLEDPCDQRHIDWKRPMRWVEP